MGLWSADYHKREGRTQSVLVFFADHRAFDDGRMAGQDVFDFQRGHKDAPDLEQIVGASVVVEESIFVAVNKPPDTTQSPRSVALLVRALENNRELPSHRTPTMCAFHPVERRYRRLRSVRCSRERAVRESPLAPVRVDSKCRYETAPPTRFHQESRLRTSAESAR